ncbi:hypothetical protein BDL97_13G088600 [Sphagnum fallax]|nr:hypothetical protein BDL97_13G088600 [Sphagnum fallax]
MFGHRWSDRHRRVQKNPSQRCVSLSCAADCSSPPPPPPRHPPFLASTKSNGIQEGGKKEDLACFQRPLFGSLDSRRERVGGGVGGGGRATRAPALLGSSYWDLLVALRSLPYWILKAFVLSLLVTIWSFSFLLYWVAFWATELLSCLAAVASLLQQFFLTQLRKSKLLVRCCFVGLACSLGAYVSKLH